MSNINQFDKYRLIEQYFEGSLSPAEEKKALYLIAEDDELRSMFRFELSLSKMLHESEEPASFSVPATFTDDVMSRIKQMEEKKTPDYSWADKIYEMISGWFAPRQYTFRPALAYVIPAVLLIVYTGFFRGGAQPEKLDLNQVGMDSGIESSTQTKYISESQSATEEVWIRFVYIDEDAEQVAVAGNFSDWEPVEMASQEMNGKKVWTGLVPVERGEHHYMFIKDGEEWISDPLAEIQRDDGFGNKNAVIFL